MENIDHSSENLNVAVVSFNSIKDAQWLNNLADKIEERKPEKVKIIANLRTLAKNTLAAYSVIATLKEKSDSLTSREWELRKKLKRAELENERYKERMENMLQELFRQSEEIEVQQKLINELKEIQNNANRYFRPTESLHSGCSDNSEDSNDQEGSTDIHNGDQEVS